MEHIFTIPKKALNTNIFNAETGWDLFIRDGELIISGECTKEQAKAALDAHDGTVPEPTINEKLASVGLSIDDLKAALGI